jgi:para-aminobenzoate synthetase component 2
MYGKTSLIEHDGAGVFAGIDSPCEVGRYHSLIAEESSLPAELQITARTHEGEIMGLRHRTLSIEGVQFHPESVLTPSGPQMMENFLRLAAGRR